MTKTNTSLMARVVRINFEERPSGAVFATSPQLKGLLVSKMSYAEARGDVARAITELYAACGESVVVTEVAPEDDKTADAWVAVPSVVAKEALEHA